MGGAEVIRRYSNLYGYFLVQRFKILMEYRANFLIGMTSTVILQAAGLLTLWVVMSQIPDLNGWSFDELLLVYGLLTLSGSLNHMFADNLWILGDAYVRTGGFDRFLVRPIDPLFHLLADRFCHDGIGTFLIGSALVVKAWTALGIALTPFNLLYLTVAVLSGGAIFIALNLFAATSSFWVTMSTPVVWSVHSTSEFAKFPLSIYHGGVRVLMTWLLPYGFVSFYPASYLLGREVGALVWLGPVVAGVLLFVSYRFWRFGLRRYSSTGS